MAQKKRSSKTPRGAIGSDPFAEMGEAAADDSEQEVSLPAAKKTTGKSTTKDQEPDSQAVPDSPPADSPGANAESAAQAVQESGSDGGSQVKSEPATSDVVLPEVVMLPNAAEISDMIADALGRGEPFNIDAGALERVDTAGMQLLLAAVSQGRSQGLTVKLENASEIVREKARMLDLGAQLGLTDN